VHRKFLVILLYCVPVLALLSACNSEIPEDPGPVTRQVQLEVDHTLREFWLHDPFTGDDRARPLLIVLHGLESDGHEILVTGGFFAHAAEAGYVVAAPNALGGAFNDGSGRSTTNADDVAFIDAVIESVRKGARIDDQRIYLMGFSSGGSMALKLDREARFRFAGIGVVAGHDWSPAPARVRPIPTIFIFGDSDPYYPLTGGDYVYAGRTYTTPPPASVARSWARSLHCTTTVSARVSHATHTGRYGCDADTSVVYLQIENHGHYWPHVPEERELVLERRGPMQRNVDATRIIWKFLTRG